ncbi:putative cytochrome P450 [Talaromyces proteolyticus]|uniref:Cytochrome P450 n=1 Tax=Talaromyces proteolyticus TaxID=1131652 RepID=A0AAD4PSS0_9EURO|nr:putative cytochrome P450 [Talaromyces proteolyticus]KAH8689533.1 putative cytochrome P450 [Talaromyces proteolyticus]
MISIENALTCIVGIATHLLYFNRGEHHLHPQRYLQAFIFTSVAVAAFLSLRHSFPFYHAVRVTAILDLYFLGGLYASLLVYRQFFHPLNKFPGPFGTRVSGFFLSLKFLKADSAFQYLRLHQKYGYFVRVGSSDLSITHPKGMSAVYGPGSSCTKGDAYDVTNPVVSLHSFRNRQSHDNRRRVWSSAFGDTALRGYEKRIRQYRDMLMSTFAETKGRPINVTQWFNNYSFDVVGDLAFGRSFDMLKNDNDHWAVVLLAEGFKPLALSPPTWLFRLAQHIPGATKDWFRFLDFCRRRILKRMQNKPDIPDITSTLLAPLEGREPTTEDLNLLVGDSQLMMAAGGDTTATTLSSIIYELCLHPEQIEQLRQLVGPYMTDPSGDVLSEKIAHIEHLNGVIYEALRLHPPVPAIIQRKTPPEGIWVDDVFVPGETSVFCPQYALGRSTDIYVNPEAFIPERWYSRPELVKEKSAFAPFLSGTYGCIGRPLAMMNLRSTLARLITTFDIKFGEGEDGSSFEGKSTNHFLWCPGDLYISFTRRTAVGTKLFI